MNKDQRVIFDISIKAILKIVLVFLVLAFLYFVRDIILMVLVAIILASLISPLVDWLSNKKIPRTVSVLLVYITLLSLVGFLGSLIIPPVADQLKQLAARIPSYIDRLSETFGGVQKLSDDYYIVTSSQEFLKSLGNQLAGLADNAFLLVVRILGGFVAFITILALAFYLIVEKNGLKKFLISILPQKHEENVVRLVNEIQKKIGLWLRGQLVLMVFVGGLSLIGLLVLRIDYALTLALIFGIMEIIPIVGPILAAVPAIILAFAQSPALVPVIIFLYIIIQQIENSILVPKIMQKTVGLNPAVVLISILIGAKLLGIIGIIIAVPVATAVNVILKDIWGDKELEKI